MVLCNLLVNSQSPCAKKKVFIMHNFLVEQNCTKHLPFLLMSDSPFLPITLFHVLFSVPTYALKSPNRTIYSADVTFCKAIPASSKKGWYCDLAFGACTCKMHSDCSCSLSLRRQNLPPSEI